MNELPIACTLTTAELHERRAGILEKFQHSIVDAKELDNGYAYSLSSAEASLSDLGTMIELERQCCPFLRFKLTVEPAGGPVWLELTGPAGTKEFLAALITDPTNRAKLS